jgi:vacuolar protein sorting-associated protein 13A/C
VLIQEFAIKVDQGFLSSVVAIFESTIASNDEDRRLRAFQRECQLATRSLLDDAEYSTVGVVKNFFDDLHFSPLKVGIKFLFILRFSSPSGIVLPTELKS